MSLSSLTDSLRSRFANLNPLNRPVAQAATVSEAKTASTSTPDTKVELGGRDSGPSIYDRFGQLSSNDAASARQRANEKVAELKKRMKLLKSMMAGASPAQRKALARQLGQIANELKAAVKNFSDASGSGQTSAPKSANAAISPDTTAQQANPQTATAGSTPDSTGANSTETDKHQANAQTATASGQSGQGASNKEKQDFVREAKELASDIKRTLEMLKRKLRRQSDSVVRQAEKALGDIGKMLNNLSGGATQSSAGSGDASLNIQVAAVSPASNPGSVSISAGSVTAD